MASEEIAALAAQVNQLDRETARRVVRLVLECNASLRMALSAVQETNRSARTEDIQSANSSENLRTWWFPVWNKMYDGRKQIRGLSVRG
jgi:hypothetical protein